MTKHILFYNFMSCLALINITVEPSVVHLCGGLTLAGGQVPTKAALSLPLLNWTRERKYEERFVG